MANTYLPDSETYLAVKDGDIAGFIAMVENHLAAIFVKTDLQGQGIGKTLLNYVKDKRETIQLKVYKKNTKSVEFYKTYKNDEKLGAINILVKKIIKR